MYYVVVPCCPKVSSGSWTNCVQYFHSRHIFVDSADFVDLGCEQNKWTIGETGQLAEFYGIFKIFPGSNPSQGTQAMLTQETKKV